MGPVAAHGPPAWGLDSFVVAQTAWKQSGAMTALDTTEPQFIRESRRDANLQWHYRHRSKEAGEKERGGRSDTRLGV